MYLLGLLLPIVANAEELTSSGSFVDGVINRFISSVINPLLAILFALAFVLFLWGAANFIWNAADKTAKDNGKNHMIWGVVGMIIMISAYGIMNLVGSIIGIAPR